MKIKKESSKTYQNPALNKFLSKESLLSLEEQSSVLTALSRGTGGDFTESEAKMALKWASDSRLRNNMLQLAFWGKLQIRFSENGEITFRAHDEGNVQGRN